MSTLTEMLQKNFIFIIIMALAVLAIGACRTSRKKKSSPAQEISTLKRACPEAWYRNLMPGPGKTQPEEYLIFNGVREETRDYDLEWIRKNCSIKGPSDVH